MPLSKPALISAFVCPGLGQWVAGYRLFGAFLVFAATGSVLSPFVAMIWGIVMPPPCDPMDGLWECNKVALLSGLWTSLPVFLVAVPVFVIVYATAVLHANTLTVPEK